MKCSFNLIIPRYLILFKNVIQSSLFLKSIIIVISFEYDERENIDDASEISWIENFSSKSRIKLRPSVN